MRGSYLGPAYGLDDILARLQAIPTRPAGSCRMKNSCGNRCGSSGRRQCGGLVSGPHGIRPARFGQQEHSGRSAQPRNAETPESENQIPRRFPAFCALSAGRRRRRVFRTVGYFTLYASGGSGGGTVAQTPCPKAIRLCRCGERLYFQRSELPSITHIDYSARVQTISRETNPRYWALARAFKDRHGCPVLINTSFNVRGEPWSARRRTPMSASCARKWTIWCWAMCSWPKRISPRCLMTAAGAQHTCWIDRCRNGGPF